MLFVNRFPRFNFVEEHFKHSFIFNWLYDFGN